MKSILFKGFKINLIGQMGPDDVMMTRRIIKPQPDTHFAGGIPFVFGDIDKEIKPRFYFGETVYLKEACLAWCGGITGTGDIIYKADELDDYEAAKKDISILKKNGFPNGKVGCWKVISPLFMPEKFARYFIQITNVRAERIQKITDDDARLEGIPDCEKYPRRPDDDECYVCNALKKGCLTRMGFKGVWDETNGPGAWDRNDWVFVYTYKRVTP
jgi:hypothetical protein